MASVVEPELPLLWKSFPEQSSSSDGTTMPEMLRQQLLDTSRGRIVTLLREGGRTADDIAAKLGLTRSAVRLQIAAMERDGVVQRTGKRPGTTRPSYVYGLTPEVEQLRAACDADTSGAELPAVCPLYGLPDLAMAPHQPGGSRRDLFMRADHQRAARAQRRAQRGGHLALQ